MISRKTASAIGIAGLALLVTLPALSQGPGRHSVRRYNPATEVRETGTVESVRQAGGNRGWTGTHILLKTEKEDLDVHVGPTEYLAESGFTFAKGDHIEVLGSRVRVGATDALLAREVQKEGKTLVLRDGNGIPKWSPYPISVASSRGETEGCLRARNRREAQTVKHRPVGLSAGLPPVDEVLEFAAGFEKGNPLGRDVNRSASFGIAGHARPSRACAKAAESSQFHFIAGPNRSHHAFQHQLHNGCAFLQRNLGGARNFFDD